MQKAIHVTDWIALIILIDITFIAFLRHYFPKRFIAFIKIPFNTSYFTEFAQEKEQPFWFELISEIIMLISISLFIYALIYIGGDKTVHSNDYLIFIKIFLASVLFVTIQRFFHSLTGQLFNMQKNLTMLMHVKDGYLRWAAPLLIIIISLSVFINYPITMLLYIGVGILALVYVIGIIRGSTLLAGNKTLSGMHIFFYLCTLEILPVVALVKMLA
jgi:hypothetical protein